MRPLFLFLFLLTNTVTIAQFTDRVWCFGDSVKMEFASGGVVVNNTSGMFSIKPAGSICDSTGNLLFYIGTYSSNPSVSSSYSGAVWDGNDQILASGDSIKIADQGSDGLIILPFDEGTVRKYYVIHHPPYLAITTFYFNWSLIIDSNNILSVQSKNNLLSNMSSAAKLAAVKHGNGKDWWLVTHSILGDTFCVYLVDSNGIHPPVYQSIGSSYNNVFPYQGLNGELVFSKFGNHLGAVSNDIIDLFDFDRCTGTISNFRNLMSMPTNNPDQFYAACSFSPNERFFYISNLGLNGNPGFRTHHTLQFDLQSTPIVSSRCTVNLVTSDYSAFQHQLGPDGRIYLTRSDAGFPTMVTDTGSTYLSVIENPNDPCPSVVFNTFGQGLDGRRCLGSLPNNPNYELGRVEPNGCVSGLPSASLLGNISVYPSPAIDQIQISSSRSLNGTIIPLFNLQGQQLLQQTTGFGNVFEVELPKCIGTGIYFLRIQAKEGVVTKKVVVR